MNASNAAVASRGRTIVYWVTTLLLGTEGIVGGVLAFIQYPQYVGIIRHLGYPVYFMAIIAVWYTLVGVALLIPRFPRVKEWAYAGLVINYTGPAASHNSAGDPVGALVAPAIFTTLTIASWALRPSTRALCPPSYGDVASERRASVYAWWTRRGR